MKYKVFTRSDGAQIVRLPDGYNGDTMLFFADPVEEDGEDVKLLCAEPGKSFLIRWARKQELKPEDRLTYACGCSYPSGEGDKYYDHNCATCHREGWTRPVKK